MAVGDAHVFPGFLTLVLTQLCFQSRLLLFSHASAEVRGENTPERKFASNGSRTHNHLVTHTHTHTHTHAHAHARTHARTHAHTQNYRTCIVNFRFFYLLIYEYICKSYSLGFISASYFIML